MSQKLTYVAASNIRPGKFQDESVAVVHFDHVTRKWIEAGIATYESISDFRQVTKNEIPGCRMFRIGF